MSGNLLTKGPDVSIPQLLDSTQRSERAWLRPCDIVRTRRTLASAQTLSAVIQSVQRSSTAGSRYLDWHPWRQT